MVGCGVGGYALTSSRCVVEGAPSHPYPTMGTASGCGTTTTPLVLPVKTGIDGGASVGVRSSVEPVRSPRCAQPPLPHHGYRIGVRHDGVVCRGRNTWWPPPRLTGENRYPWRGDSGGYALTPSRSVVEDAPSRPYPTMGTASGCGTTTTSPRLTGENRYPWWRDGGGYALTSSRSVVEGAPSHPYPTIGTASGCGTTVWCVGPEYTVSTAPLVLPAKGRRTTPRCGAGVHTPLRLTGEYRYPRYPW